MRAMLDRADGARSLRRQCALVGVARSGVYRPVKRANDNDAALMRRIDELFTAWPFLGSRRMTAMSGTKRVTKQQDLGIPNPTKSSPLGRGHQVSASIRYSL